MVGSYFGGSAVVPGHGEPLQDPTKKGRKRGGRKKGRKEMGWEGGVWNASMRQEGG